MSPMIIVQILHDRLCQRDAVVGGGAAPQLIHEDEAVGGDVVEDDRRLGHLNHKRTLTARDVVRRPHAGEDSIHDAEVRLTCRDKGAHLSHQHDEGGLPQECALTRHIGSGDHHDLVCLRVAEDIIGDILLARRHHPLNHGMAPLLDVNDSASVHHRTVVIVCNRIVSKGAQHVDLGESSCIALQDADMPHHLPDQILVKLCLEDADPLLGTEDLLLILLQLRGDVSLAIDQGLLPDPVLRHLILMRIGHLNVVAKDVIEGNLQRWDPGLTTLPLTHLKEVLLAPTGDGAQLIQSAAHAGTDHPSLTHLCRCIGVDGLLDL